MLPSLNGQQGTTAYKCRLTELYVELPSWELRGVPSRHQNQKEMIFLFPRRDMLEKIGQCEIGAAIVTFAEAQF